MISWEEFRNRRFKPPAKVEEPPVPTPIPAIAEWSSARGHEDFDKYLNEWLDRADARARLSYLNHAETSFWLGYGCALETLREHFTAWRDNRTPTPQKGIMP